MAFKFYCWQQFEILDFTNPLLRSSRDIVSVKSIAFSGSKDFDFLNNLYELYIMLSPISRLRINKYITKLNQCLIFVEVNKVSSLYYIGLHNMLFPSYFQYI